MFQTLSRLALCCTALGLLTATAGAQLTTQDMTTGITVDDLIDALVGTDPNAPIVSNVTINCDPQAAGLFAGGLASGLDFEDGIILSSGCIDNVIAQGGMNNSNSTTCSFGLPGDPDLDALIPQDTFDACVLEFDFECEDVQILSFQYVFASEEYNQFVNTQFNDVFAFFVNGVNIALLPDGVTPVSINNVNCGNPTGDPTPSNCGFFVNNSCQGPPGFPNVPFPCVPPAIESEMDGFTVTLVATTVINPGVNHIKLAIADAGDTVLDSVVFIKGESFVCGLIDEGCVRSQGFWKNHPDEWPVDELDLGNVTYDKDELIAILKQPVKGNGLVSLSKQLIAALLNQANGAGTTLDVQDAIDDAHMLIGDLVVPPIGNGWIHPSITGGVKDVLDEYNNGMAPGGPEKCDESRAVGEALQLQLQAPMRGKVLPKR